VATQENVRSAYNAETREREAGVEEAGAGEQGQDERGVCLDVGRAAVE
jgi:hypothetical protein